MRDRADLGLVIRMTVHELQRARTWRGSAGILVITLGTGVGVAALTDGRLFRGADSGHPEAGHIPAGGPTAPCYCGLPNCWEQLASRTALDHLTGNDTEALTAKAPDGDVAAARVFDTQVNASGTELSAS
jgi:glucokinase